MLTGELGIAEPPAELTLFPPLDPPEELGEDADPEVEPPPRGSALPTVVPPPDGRFCAAARAGISHRSAAHNKARAFVFITNSLLHLGWSDNTLSRAAASLPRTLLLCSAFCHFRGRRREHRDTSFTRKEKPVCAL